MMYQIKRSEEDIAEQRALARGFLGSSTSSQPDRTFEDGMTWALDWLFGDVDEPPFGLKDVES